MRAMGEIESTRSSMQDLILLPPLPSLYFQVSKAKTSSEIQRAHRPTAYELIANCLLTFTKLVLAFSQRGALFQSSEHTLDVCFILLQPELQRRPLLGSELSDGAPLDDDNLAKLVHLGLH